MLTNNTPIPDAELAEVKRLHAAAPAGTWVVGKNKASGRVQIHNGQHQVCAVWHTAAHPAMETAEAIAALHNAFPALNERLEELTAERDQLRAEVEDWKHHLAIEVERSAAAESHVALLRGAGQKVIDRWDSPKWADLPHTGVIINELRAALALTSAGAVGKVKAEALRGMADRLDKQCCECHDECIQDLLEEADRLEASNG